MNEKNFDEMIKRLEDEVLEIKSITRRASENIGTITKSTTIYPVLRGYKDYFGNKATARGIIVIRINTDGEANLACIACKTPFNGRFYTIGTRVSQNYDTEFLFNLSPSTADVNELNGSGTKTVPIEIQVTCTSDFEFVITEELLS